MIASHKPAVFVAATIAVFGVVAVSVSVSFAAAGDPGNIDIAPFDVQARDPILEGPLIGGSDVIPTDAAGFGPAHIKRLPVEGEMSEIEMLMAYETVAATNFERARRDTDPGPGFSPGTYPLQLSENLTRIQHRWAEWAAEETEASGEMCPSIDAPGLESSCHSLWPNWDNSIFMNYGITLQDDGGGAAMSQWPMYPGQMAAGWFQSSPHRPAALTNTSRFASLAIDCRPSGLTPIVEWSGWDTDVGILLREPATGWTPDATTTIPADYGHRRPQPADITTDNNNITIQMAYTPGLTALKTQYQYDLNQPPDPAPLDTWQVHIELRDNAGTLIHSDSFDWFTTPDGSECGALTINDLDDGIYTATIWQPNQYETSLTATQQINIGNVPQPAPTSDMRFDPITPYRAADTRLTQPGKIGAGTTRKFTLDAPDDATAVTLNLIGVNPTSNGYITVYPCDANTRPVVSNLNTIIGVTRPNHVAVGATKTVCFYSATNADIVVDLTGIWTTNTTGTLTPHPTPQRTLDTRTKGPGLVWRSPTNSDFQIHPQQDATLFANLAATQADQPGWIAVFSCGDGYNATSTANYPAVNATSNAVIVDASRGGVCARSLHPVHVIFDVFATTQ